MSIDVTALGELLIDFTPAGRSAQGNALYEQNPGGAPANVLAAVARQGGTAALLSAVGNDGFGIYLKDIVKGLGVQSDGIQTTAAAATTLAFVSLNEAGDRSFNFCRKPGADQMLERSKLDMRLLDDTSIFHFGSLSLCGGPAREATLFAAEYTKAHGKLISYDPNWRPPLWPDETTGVAGMKLGLPFANVLKLSEEELTLLTGEGDVSRGTEKLFTTHPELRLAVVTLGPRGCFYRTAWYNGRLPTYDTKVVDTTGAGDAFWGALLGRLAVNPDCLSPEQDNVLRNMLDFANASGSYCAAGRGAIPSIPTTAQVENLRHSCPHLTV